MAYLHAIRVRYFFRAGFLSAWAHSRRPLDLRFTIWYLRLCLRRVGFHPQIRQVRAKRVNPAMDTDGRRRLQEKTLRSCLLCQDVLYEGLELRQVAMRGVPHDLEIHAEVFMDQNVPHSRSGFIDRFRLLEDLIAEILAQRLRCEQVHLSAECFGELVLDLDELEQADSRLRVEIDQHVDVAVVPGRTMNVGEYRGQPPIIKRRGVLAYGLGDQETRDKAEKWQAISDR